MSAAAQTPLTNRLIAGLPPKARNRLLMHCESVDLAFGTVLCEQGRPYRYAYFPLTAFISLVLPIDGHPPLAMGLIGNEGMLGATLVLGIDAVPVRAVVIGAGGAWRISAKLLRRDMGDNLTLRDALNRYLYVLNVELAQNATCTCFHEVELRLARWLLMAHDRAHGDHFNLTHQCLADMLGVQRSAITIAAGRLQKRRLIRYSRGRIDVLSRSGLEGVSCGCYAALVRAHARALPC